MCYNETPTNESGFVSFDYAQRIVGQVMNKTPTETEVFFKGLLRYPKLLGPVREVACNEKCFVQLKLTSSSFVIFTYPKRSGSLLFAGSRLFETESNNPHR